MRFPKRALNIRQASKPGTPGKQGASRKTPTFAGPEEPLNIKREKQRTNKSLRQKDLVRERRLLIVETALNQLKAQKQKNGGKKTRFAIRQEGRSKKKELNEGKSG